MNIDLPHIARLSGLRIEEYKLPQLQQDFEDMLAMINHLPEEPDMLPVDQDNCMQLREDTAEAGKFTRDALLQNAPAVQSGCAVVPKTVE